MRIISYRFSLCGDRKPPRTIFHDDYVPNNYGIPVPGLQAVALEHSAWATPSLGGVRFSQVTHGLEIQDQLYFENHDQRSVSCEHRTISCKSSTGWPCMHMNMTCDYGITRLAYQNALKYRTPVKDLGLLDTEPRPPHVLRERTMSTLAAEACKCVEFSHRLVHAHGTVRIRDRRAVFNASHTSLTHSPPASTWLSASSTIQ